MTAFACAKVSVKGKRHWYKAVEQTAFVALSDDSAWIIRTNGDLYLQTGNCLHRYSAVGPLGTGLIRGQAASSEQRFVKECRSKCYERVSASSSRGSPSSFPFDVAELHKSHVTIGKFTEK